MILFAYIDMQGFLKFLNYSLNTSSTPDKHILDPV